MTSKIRSRRDTAANWASVNPVLADGEFGYEKPPSSKLKIGDGVSAWNDLPYHAPAPAATASQGEMEAGTEAGLRMMSPFGVKQAILALSPAGGGAKDLMLDTQGFHFAPVTLSGPSPDDFFGAPVLDGYIVFLLGQTDPLENGLYTVNNFGPWTQTVTYVELGNASVVWLKYQYGGLLYPLVFDTGGTPVGGMGILKRSPIFITPFPLTISGGVVTGHSFYIQDYSLQMPSGGSVLLDVIQQFLYPITGRITVTQNSNTPSSLTFGPSWVREDGAAYQDINQVLGSTSVVIFESVDTKVYYRLLT